MGEPHASLPCISCSLQSRSSGTPRLSRNPWAKSMLWCLLTFQGFFGLTLFLASTDFFFLDQLNNALKMIFEKVYFSILVVSFGGFFRIFSLLFCWKWKFFTPWSFYFTCYFFPLERKMKVYFLFTGMDNMNLKVCLWMWNSISAILYLEFDISPSERLLFSFLILGILFSPPSRR